MDPLHVCIMGHSGVGKSPLAKLFSPRIKGWDPFRVREPRPGDDKTMSKEDFRTLLTTGEVTIKDKKLERGKLVFPDHGGSETNSVIEQFYTDTRLCVCEGWSFFKVRTDDQCLSHADFKPNESMRIEVFPPVLLEMVRKRRELSAAFSLDPAKLLVVILNPTSISLYDTEKNPLPELQVATAMAVMERKRVKGEVPDLADAMRRVGHLQQELCAWRGFMSDPDIKTLECLQWPHFEYCYASDEQSEREGARLSIFKAVQSAVKAKKWTESEGQAWAYRLLMCMV